MQLRKQTQQHAICLQGGLNVCTTGTAAAVAVPANSGSVHASAATFLHAPLAAVAVTFAQTFRAAAVAATQQ